LIGRPAKLPRILLKGKPKTLPPEDYFDDPRPIIPDSIEALQRPPASEVHSDGFVGSFLSDIDRAVGSSGGQL
jgi:hypothetical protein